MMGRIDNTFAKLAENKKKALVTFITAGDPDLETTESLIIDLEKAGADLIELGVPFSDPMADGPTIQLSSERALAAGTTLPKILSTVKSVRRKTQIPIILMGYYNPIFLHGVDRFVSDAVAAGVDGVLLVDLPPEEAGEFRAIAARSGLAVIFLLTPTSDEERIRKVARLGSGFIYYVSVTGVTGARSSIAENVFPDVQKIRERVTLPVVVGFGISDPAQAGSIASVADGVVVGSALVRQFEQFSGKELHTKLSTMVSALKAGIAA